MGEVRPELTRWLTTEGGVADELRAVFVDTGLNQARFADRLGWSKSKVSRYMSGKTIPSADDVRWWCVQAGAVERAEPIVSMLASSGLRQFSWRQRIASGYGSIQDQYTELHRRCELVQMVDLTMIPGPLQTMGYAEAVLETAARFYGADPDEAKAAAGARMERAELVTSPDPPLYQIVVSEAALLGGPCPDRAVRHQLTRITDLVTAGVDIRVLPLRFGLEVLPSNSFAIYTPEGDDPFVLVETFHGEAEYTTIDDVGVYQRAFEWLARCSVGGDDIAPLIRSARRRLK